MRLVLLHALARSARSMRSLGEALQHEGHDVRCIDLPTTRKTLPELAESVLERIADFQPPDAEGLGFVGHSMGGLVYRALPMVRPDFRCGPSVTIGTPANGSVVARALARTAPFRAVYGPALATLAPEHVAAMPAFPGPTLCIAGDRATPWVPAYWVLRALGERSPSDSTVLVDEALHRQALAHRVVHAAHTFLPDHPEVRRAVLGFVADRSPERH